VVAPKKYPDELRARAVRLYRESEPKPLIRRLADPNATKASALRCPRCQICPASQGGACGLRIDVTFRKDAAQR
jgi:hypothetical protein